MLAAQAAQMRQDGALLREISEALGVSYQYAQQLVADPDGLKARARKDSYAQPCEICGAPTSGSEGRREHPRCQPCAAFISGAKRASRTADHLISRIQEWAALYGEPPAIPDWNPWACRNVIHDPERARRYEEANGYWPSFTSVVYAFGSWNAGIEAAGFTPRPETGARENAMRQRRVRARAEAS